MPCHRVVVSTPGAFAADAATYAEQFRAADLNNDAVLSRSEIGDAKSKLPSGISERDYITRTDFMAACTNSI
jgi:hypothetical protein